MASWPRREPLRWLVLGCAVAVLVAFLVAQEQSTGASYGRPDAASGIERSRTGGDGATTLPPVAQLTAMLAADPVVRLPGAVATWDEQLVQAAIGDADVRILVAPAGLDESGRSRMLEVENASVRIAGTRVAGGIYEAVPDSLAGWRAQFATGDVTGPLVTLIAELTDQPAPPERDRWRWRDPTRAELDAVLPDLRDSGLHVAEGATLDGIPAEAAEAAFPEREAVYLALPPQPAGEPVPRYGPALSDRLPDTPVVVLYGSWVEYHGPAAEEFAEVAAVSFYAQFHELLSHSDYPQRAVLAAFLNRVADIRYAGLFDRPLPYQPFDPLAVALPALPWLFAACVVGFLLLSMRRLRGGRPVRRPGPPARLAGLSALAVEMSLLTDRRGDPPLVRGVGKLQAARSALAEELPDQHVRDLLDDAWTELDSAARTTGLPFFRPRHYLRDWLS